MPDLSTRTARRAIPAGPARHWIRQARGLALGYRRGPSQEAGTWYVRKYLDGSYVVRRLAEADDVEEANGRTILDHKEAARAASEWEPLEDDPKAPAGQITVAEACESYIEDFDGTPGGRRQVESVLSKHVIPELGTVRLAKLSARRLRRWRRELAESPARLRGGHVRHAKTEDQRRARKSSANRALSVLKAALNKAVRDGDAKTGEWVDVKPFKRVDAARDRWLEAQEITRLLNVCDPDFRRLVEAALHTGARYAELAALRVGDFKPEAAAVYIRPAKTEKGRHVYLTEEGQAFFEALTAGRDSREWLLTRPGACQAILERARQFDRDPTELERARADALSGDSDTPPWGRSEQRRKILEACAAANIDPGITFHGLRHSYSSHYIQNGGSLSSLARQLGHTSNRMVEDHYGHLADSWRAEEARKHAPRIGSKRQKVARMRQR